MTDRELIELAAKAAGIDGRYASLGEFPDWMTVHDGEGIYYTSSQAWNPLTDDGDALRLAVKLAIDVNHGTKIIVAECPTKDIGCAEGYTEGEGATATRRAIVRAAAEIGKGMP